MEDVKEAYAEASGREVTVSSHKINKMNDSYEAITIDVSFFTDYSLMKENIAVEVVSAERNKEMLETVPHQMMEDMAVVYKAGH